MRGDLSIIRLDGILHAATYSGMNCSLSIIDKNRYKHIYLDNGFVQLLRSSHPSTRWMSKLTVRERALSLDKMKAAIRTNKISSFQVAKFVVDKTSDKNGLYDALVEQVIDEMCDVIKWDNAKFELTSGMTYNPTNPTKVPIEAILLEAARRSDHDVKDQSNSKTNICIISSLRSFGCFMRDELRKCNIDADYFASSEELCNLKSYDAIIIDPIDVDDICNYSNIMSEAMSIILISNPSKDVIIKCARYGASDILCKPVSAGVIASRLAIKLKAAD